MTNSIYISKTAKCYKIMSDNSPAVLLFIRKIPSAVYNATDKCWDVNIKDAIFVRHLGEYLKERGIVKDVIFQESLEDVNVWADNMPDLAYPYKLKFEPYDYQKKGIQYMVEHKRTFNGDDMGLGKTFQSIAAVSIAKAYPCLVVCPAAMKMTWKREFMKFIGKNAVILDNENKDNWQQMFITGTCNVFITNYESVKKFFIRRIKGNRISVKNLVVDQRASIFKTVIIDESHRVKNSSCHYAKYLEAICKGKEYIFMLTGTPVVTRVRDLVQQLKVMGRIDDFGGATRFISRFCSSSVTNEELGLLNSLLWRTCYFRREKTLVLKELPEKIRQYYSCELTNRKEYDSAEQDLARYLKKYKDASDDKLKTLIANEAIVKIGVLRQISAEGKISEAKKIIADYISAQKKVIVFTAHKSIASKIKQSFPDAVTVTGSDSPEQKQKSVDSFQNDTECKVIIVNIQSGGVGITLTAASDVLFVEMPWTSADCDQCECRAHRNGQKNVVTCVYLLGKNTFDERMYDLIQKERSISSIITGAVNDKREQIITRMTELLNVS